MRELGDFLLERQLGRGATAQVYLAIRKNDQKKVALKVFHPGLWEQKEMRARAMAEVRAVSGLQHANIVQIIEALWTHEPPAVVMEFIDGVSLEEFQGRLPYILPEISVRIVVEILKALELAHARGVIHRDLKPANILIGNDGRILVSDFGLAKMVDVSRLTLSGTIIGSPDYMSPEQARGDITHAKSDLFSVASILYFLVTGTRPFTRHTPFATLTAVTEAKPEAPERKNPKLSRALAKIINRGLSRNPDERFASAEEFRKELENYLLTVGLNEENFQFIAWMRSPADTVVFSLKTIAETLAGRAESEIIEGQWDSSVSSISHLSQVAPESAAIPRLLEILTSARRGKNRRKVWGRSLVALLFIFAGGSIFWGANQYRHSGNQITLAAPLIETSAKTVTVAASNSGRPVIAEKEVKLKKSSSFEKAKVTVLKAKTGIVRFDVSSEVGVFWDGKEIEDPSVALNSEKIGPHRLKLVMDGHPPVESVIKVSAHEPTVIKVR